MNIKQITKVDALRRMKARARGHGISEFATSLRMQEEAPHLQHLATNSSDRHTRAVERHFAMVEAHITKQTSQLELIANSAVILSSKA